MTKRLLTLLAMLALSISITAQAQQTTTDQTIAEIQKAIDSKGYHWTAGRSTLSDMSVEEFTKLLGYKPPKGYDEWLANQPKLVADPRAVFPTTFDWRDSGIVTPVKNQAGCGSCWDFAATGAFEAAIKHHDGITYDLSEQQALSCNVYGSSCAGGWAEPVYELFQRYGAVLESCMPYQANDAIPCTQDLCTVVAKLKSWQYVDEEVSAIKTAVLLGPVYTTFRVYQDFQSYYNGCYQHTWGSYLGGHAVVIVGWDDNACGSGQGAWICKNSWAPGWGGLGGYFYIKWGDCGIGGGTVLPLYPPDPVTLTYDKHLFLELTGDGDNVPEPGEELRLAVSLRNSGIDTASNVEGTLTTTTPGIVITGGSVTFPSIPVNQAKDSHFPHFAFRVDSTVARATRVNFTLEATCDQGTFDLGFYDYVGHFDTVFADNMESGAGGWVHSGTIDDWQRGRPTGGSRSDPTAAYSGNNAWGNNLYGDYSANAANYLESPVIDCSNVEKTKLRYFRWLSTEKGIYDQARILVNGNVVWENNQQYDLIESRWNYYDIDISAFADINSSVKVRFELTTDQGLQLGGWNIDNFAVVGIPRYLAGDANGDRAVDITDGVFLVSYIFAGGLAPVPLAAGDANCDDVVDISDVVYLVAYVFSGGAAPCY